MAEKVKLLALNLTKIYAEKKKEPQGQIKVSPGDIKFNSVEKPEISFSKEPCLKIDFEFTIKYEDYAEISVSGFLIVILDQKTLEECLELWKQKDLPNEIKLNLINIILQKCTLKSLQLEDELFLPLHIAMPKVSDPGSNQEKPTETAP